VTYSINVVSGGPDTANSVTVTETLPAGATYLSGTASQGGVTQSAGTVTAHLGNLASGGSALVLVQIQITPSTAFAASASVAAITPDPNPVDNVSSAQVTVFPAPVIGPAQNLQIAPPPVAPWAAGEAITLTWQPPSELGQGCSNVVYDILRSLVPWDFVGAECVAADLDATSATDTATPAPGQTFFYLVRAENSCGSNLGSDSAGNATVGRSCP
jgi:uncharacterized repeat protein (TIGR01451 family)